MMPHCGPPSSLSPLKHTRSTPAAIDACTDGSPARSSDRQPLPMSSTIGTFAWRARPTRSASAGRSVKPSMRKFDGCTRRNIAVAADTDASVVGDARPVRRADLAQQRARLAHHVGNAEAAADFDQLAPGDDDLAARRQAREDQHDRGGVVVDDQRGFGAGDRRDQRFGVNGPRAARALVEVVFEIAVAARERGDPLDGRLGERRAPQVGVDDDAGRVDDGPERSARPAGQGGARQDLQSMLRRVRDILAGRHARAHRVGAGPQRLDGRLRAKRRLQRADAVTLPEDVDAGNDR